MKRAMSWLLLHESNLEPGGGGEIWVNVDAAYAIESVPKGTAIRIAKDVSVYVSESVEYVIEEIKEAADEL